MNFLGQGMNIFLGLLGVHVNLFLINFPLCEYLFFFVLRPPSRHISFLMVCPYSC